MAVYSMTGYANAAAGASAGGADAGNAESATPRAGPSGPALTVELRSVNGRFLDLSFRIPDEYRALEPALRELVTAHVRRGKVELRIAGRGEVDASWPQPLPEQLNRLARLESTVLGWLPKARPLSVQEALLWCKGGHAAERADEALLEAARRAVAGLLEARAREGERLVAVLRERVARLRELADQAEPLVPAVVQKQQARFMERWQSALETTGAEQSVSRDALQERALGEAAAFAIRIDVAEELARLRSHLDEVDRLLARGGELGKRLDFLVQELLREANTLGSKAASIELTNISVEMKVAIEQLREQVQNLE